MRNSEGQAVYVTCSATKPASGRTRPRSRLLSSELYLMSQIQTNSIGSCTLILEALRGCCTQLGSLQSQGGLHVQLTEKREKREREKERERTIYWVYHIILSHYLKCLAYIFSNFTQALQNFVISILSFSFKEIEAKRVSNKVKITH